MTWPFSTTPAVNEKLKAFARTAVLHQPLDYLKAIGLDMTRYVDPDSRYFAGQGLTIDALVKQIGRMSLIGPLSSYEEKTRVDGAPIVALFVLALLAPFLVPRGFRLGASFFTVLAIGLVVLPVAALYYDARLALPSFRILGAAGAIGAWAVLFRARPWSRGLIHALSGMRRRG